MGIHNTESLLQDVTHRILWDIERETDHLISARQPDLVKVKKKKKKKKEEKEKKKKEKRICRILNFAVLADHGVKLRESEKRDKYLDITEELKNYGT